MNNVLQALIHLFKHVEKDPLKHADPKTLLDMLSQFGLSIEDLENVLTSIALVFIAHLKFSSSLPASSSAESLENYAVQPHHGMRVFAPNEMRKISKKARSFLFEIEQSGILNPKNRESIIGHLMRLNQRAEITLSQTKWMVFRTLHHSLSPSHLAYLERLLFSDVIPIH